MEEKNYLNSSKSIEFLISLTDVDKSITKTETKLYTLQTIIIKAETDLMRFDSATRFFDFQRPLTLILFYFSPVVRRTSAI